MKFKPKSESEMQSDSLLDTGLYDFEVMTAEDKVSKNGNEMIALKLRVFSDRGERHIYDYLLESTAWKLKHFCEIAGFDYENGTLIAIDCAGVCGKVKIGISKDKTGQYGPKNQVNDYLSPKEMGLAVMTPSATKQALDAPKFADDDIPF